MGALAFVELDEGLVKKSSLEAVSYAAEIEKDSIAIVFGDTSKEELDKIGQAGAVKILHVTNEQLSTPNIMAYASAIAAAMKELHCNILVLAKSSLGDPVAARVAVKMDGSMASNVTSLPDTASGFSVTQSIYTGKATAVVQLMKEHKVLAIKKNAVTIKEDGGSPQVEPFDPAIGSGDFKITVTSKEKATGEVLLPEADIVVSGGRGLKGPENWGMIEDLARTLGAATGCSKPVSDMDWRPHHEHVGQTGVKVSPTLYIAVGISGAIQHLAGVNSSKFILVINKDPEAPFFKAADFGVVGDAFEVVPKLTELLKAELG